ncbi:MAG: FtsW/RodA/SpoVE family cell cycle protein [Parachlamydiales bacterium]|nr:FtsW/RodA/SpoVE family cell cycle protein [Parachlamydiales bacterium]
MWDQKKLSRMDFRFLPVVVILIGISILIIASTTTEEEILSGILKSPFVKHQIQAFLIGCVIFLFFAGIDYHRYKEWSWILYAFVLLLLLGLYVTKPIASVHRWYRLPFGFSVQPSEYTKLILVMTLGWFLEKKASSANRLTTALQIMMIVGIPFFLILKQPDLGTALVLYPIAIVMCYFGGVHKNVLRVMVAGGIVILIVVSLLFTGVISHQKMRPFFTKFMKPYQYERLHPDSYHRRASQIAISIGGWSGSGWMKGTFSRRNWLPAAHTDSVFATYAEEFGLIGVIILMSLYYLLLYLCFNVVVIAKDHFGRLLSSGIAVYLAMHIIVNIAMMCGFLPISGVPLVLLTYGGSSIVTTMAALGILQSVYTRRFMF